MATTAKNTQDLEAATEQLKQVGDRLADAGRRIGNLYLDGYEKSVDRFTVFQKQLGEQTGNKDFQAIVNAHVELTRELSKTSTAVAREILA